MTATKRPPIQTVWVSFESSMSDSAGDVKVALHPSVTQRAHETLVAALRTVAWENLEHAYGPATDVPALLYAVTLGTEPVREQAWWDLWGNIHHQGSVYPATPAAVPFLTNIAASPGHPDRVNAIMFLWAVALGNGANADLIRSAVEKETQSLIHKWDSQPQLVQRALVMLTSAFPELLKQHPQMHNIIPKSLHPAWAQLLHSGGNITNLDLTNELMDLQAELEDWAFTGQFSSQD